MSIYCQKIEGNGTKLREELELIVHDDGGSGRENAPSKGMDPADGMGPVPTYLPMY